MGNKKTYEIIDDTRVSSFHEKLERFAKVQLCNEKLRKAEKSWEELISQHMKGSNCTLAMLLANISKTCITLFNMSSC